MLKFNKWPKIPRFETLDYIITEKIDGTNACVVIDEDGNVGAQSRTQLITPEKDNHGFAAWVQENKYELLDLGPGHHFGEWWGKGINRGYDHTQKEFTLFDWWRPDIPSCCSKVPELSGTVEEAISYLHENGSAIKPGYMNPEGIILINKHYRNAMYKIIFN